MNNDLISREALREDLRRFFPAEVLEGIEPKTLFAQIMHDIDNAPTVDIKDEIAGAYNEGYMCGSREAEKARPQGEWSFNPYDSCSYCSLCKAKAPFGYKNFCPQCGADMRKGGAE